MTKETSARLTKALARWFAACTIIGGFMYYHPMIPLVPALIAAAGTCAIVIWQALRAGSQ